jgi:hypothetical protein
MTRIVVILDGPVELAPPPSEPPLCPTCDEKSTRFITRTGNRNGNTGRPYYKCVPCNKFIVFDDTRGNDVRNPLCKCGRSSKKCVAGKDTKFPRNLWYGCRLGKCNFFARSVRTDSDGTGGVGYKANTVDDDLMGQMAKLSII